MTNITGTKVMEQLRTLEPKAWGVLAASLAVYALFMTKFLTRKSLRLPPGPTNYPIIGALFSMGPELHRVFTSMSAKYGDVMYFRLGMLPVAVISSAELAEELFKQRDGDFASRAHTQVAYSGAKYFGFGSNGFSFSPMSPTVQRMRRVCTSEFLSRSKVMSTDQSKVRNEELGAMVREINLVAQKGEPVRVAEYTHAMGMNAICRVLFGQRDYGSDVADTTELMDFKHLMTEMTHTAGKLNISDLIPPLRSLDLQGVTKEYVDIHAKQRRILSAIIDEHRRNKKASAEDNGFIDTLLSLDGKEKLTDDQIMATLSDLIIGGTDTAGSASEWALLELVRHPDILAKLNAEVESVVGKDRAVNEADVANLPYLMAISQETLRMYPPLPTLVPRMNESGVVKLGGYDMPHNTSLFVNLWKIGRDPAHWENPGEFIPERFLNKGIDGSGNNFHYIPFGAGRRKCLGITMGQLLLNLMIVTIVQAFDVKPANGKKPSDVSNREAYGIIIRPKEPLMLEAKLKVPLGIYQFPQDT